MGTGPTRSLPAVSLHVPRYENHIRSRSDCGERFCRYRL